MNLNQEQKLILAIYIDDGLIVAQDQKLISNLLNELRGEFEITYHDTNLFLGMHIERTPDGSIFSRNLCKKSFEAIQNGRS